MECAAAFISVAMADLLILRDKYDKPTAKISVDVKVSKGVPSDVNWSPATATTMDEDEMSMLSDAEENLVSPKNSKILLLGNFAPNCSDGVDPDTSSTTKQGDATLRTDAATRTQRFLRSSRRCKNKREEFSSTCKQTVHGWQEFQSRFGHLEQPSQMLVLPEPVMAEEPVNKSEKEDQSEAEEVSPQLPVAARLAQEPEMGETGLVPEHAQHPDLVVEQQEIVFAETPTFPIMQQECYDKRTQNKTEITRTPETEMHEICQLAQPSQQSIPMLLSQETNQVMMQIDAPEPIPEYRTLLPRKRAQRELSKTSTFIQKSSLDPSALVSETKREPRGEEHTLTEREDHVAEIQEKTAFTSQPETELSNDRKDFRSILSFWESMAIQNGKKRTHKHETKWGSSKGDKYISYMEKQNREREALETHCVRRIQSCFRKYKERKMESNAATQIQRLVRIFMAMKQLQRIQEQALRAHYVRVENVNGKKIRDIVQRFSEAGCAAPLLFQDCIKRNILPKEKYSRFEPNPIMFKNVNHVGSIGIQQEDFWRTQRVILQQSGRTAQHY